jgi:hypothetical protein
MAVPVLDLNLAPRPSLWRQRHLALGWSALGVGMLTLVGAVGFTWRAYHQANRAGRAAVSLTEEAKRAGRQEQQLQASLQEMDVTREQSRWKLAERILQERSLPWSRLTTELEQCMVPDMRLKALQRARSTTQQVVMKLKGEARTRQAEAGFVEALRADPVFAQVILEREAERTGGGWDFEISLPTAAVPPPFQLRAIKQGPVAPTSTPTSAGRPASTPAHATGTAAVQTQAPTPRPTTPVLVEPTGPQLNPVPPPPPANEATPARPRRPARSRTPNSGDPE